MWRIVKESKDPADYEAFLDIYPNGRFAKQARKTLARLQNEKGGTAAPKTRSPTPARAEKIDRIDQTYTVRVTANLRQAPTTKAKVVGQAKKGQKIFVLGRTVGKNWYKVSSKAGTVAYIAGNLVSKPGAETQTPDADWRKQAPTASKDPAPRVDKSKVQSSDRKADPPRTEPTPPQLGARPTQTAPVRKSPKEIEAYWTRRIDLIKDSGPHGDCALYVGDRFEDPAEFDICEERNEKIKYLQSEMDRALKAVR